MRVLGVILRFFLSPFFFFFYWYFLFSVVLLVIIFCYSKLCLGFVSFCFQLLLVFFLLPSGSRTSSRKQTPNASDNLSMLFMLRFKAFGRLLVGALWGGRWAFYFGLSLHILHPFCKPFATLLLPIPRRSLCTLMCYDIIQRYVSAILLLSLMVSLL